MLLDQQNAARAANLLLDQHFFLLVQKNPLDQHLFLDYGISQSELLLYLPFGAKQVCLEKMAAAMMVPFSHLLQVYVTTCLKFNIDTR
jgi:hypothetical protein